MEEQSSEAKVNIEGPSEYEKAAREARAQYSPATVSLLQSRKSKGSMKVFTGNAFVIKLDQGGCKLLTCQHIIRQNLIDEDYQLWARFFGANEDVEVTIDHEHYNVEKDLAILNVAKVPHTPVDPIALEFTRKCKVGTTVTLLGYFNPDSLNGLLGTNDFIAKNPNAVPGKISGELVLDSKCPEENWLLPVDNYGILGSCGSPIISDTGKVVAMYKQSIQQIHFGIATKTIKEQLRKWLQASKETSLTEMIEEL